MKRFLVYLFIEIILLGIVVYFLAKWNQPINNRWIDTTHNSIGFMLLVFPIINLIVCYVSFSRLTNKYPKNTFTEFLFDPQISQLGHQEEGNYIIELKEIEKGIWETVDEQEKLKFDMRGYICPKQYICTYFIRNIHYTVINKNKYPLIKLFKSLNLYPLSKYQNVVICFLNEGKIYKKTIVENNKTKTTFLMRLMLRFKYYLDFMFGLSVGEVRKSHIKISEEKYRNGER